MVDQIFARIGSTGDIDWYLPDHQGTIRHIVDNSGAVIDEIKYDSFGNILSETSPANGDRYKYTGREWDEELGLYYYRRRLSLGRTVVR